MATPRANESADLPVFRFINGELVRVPGDIRDPKRRYSAVCTPEGNYYREFTEEEEHSRDVEEALWEEEMPKREAEAEKRKESAAQFRSSLKYETRLILLADILGWSSAVRTSHLDIERTAKLGIALTQLQNQASLVNWMRVNSGDSGWPGDPRLTCFSDCLLASATADLNGREWLISTLRFLTTVLFQQGFVLRGGVSIGPLYHSDSIVFGPALVRADELEKSAIYPRVILEPDLYSAWGQGMRVLRKDGSEIGRSRTWRTSSDECAFFDFLQPFPDIPGHEYSQQELERVFTPARDRIVEGLRKSVNDKKVHDKYIWLANYFNDVLGDHSKNTVSVIDVNAL